MPTNNIFHHDGWRLEMDSALHRSKYYDSPYDFLDGFLGRESKMKRSDYQTKPSKAYSVASGCCLDKRERSEISSEKKPFSGEDFVRGFEKRQRETTRDSSVRHNTKASESSVLFKHDLDKRQKLRSSAENKPFSGIDFLDGFTQKTKPGIDPCGSFNHKRELLHNSGEQNIQSPSASFTQKPPIVSTTKSKRNEFVQHTKSSYSHSVRESTLDGRERLNHSSDWNSPSSYSSKPPFVPTQTSSQSTQYLSTRTSSSQSSVASEGSLGDQERWQRSSVDQNHHVPYTSKPVTIRTPSPTTEDISTTTTTSRSNSFYYAGQIINEAQWQELEKKSQNEQKEFLEKFVQEGKFRDEEVSSITKNIRRGDHILCQGSFGKLYNHHLLCTKVDGDYIHVIEYTGQSLGSSAASRTVATSDPLSFAAIKEGKMTYQDLEKKKAKIRKWPIELQRFTVNQIIERAESRHRKKERDYHLFRNNCEHFVNWCICGLSTSLQVQPWYQPAWDTTKGVGSAALEGIKMYGISKGLPAFLKAVGNVSDEILGAWSGSLAAAGFAVAGVIETGFAAWSIFKDYKKMQENRLSESQFKINSVSTAFKTVGRISGGIAGSIVGLAGGPLGSAIGGAIGYGVGYGIGYAVGSAVGWCYEHAPKIKEKFQDYVIAPVKKVVNTCVEAVKTAGKTVWKGVKDVFDSLFSWW